MVLRLSGVMPYSVSNYILGLTELGLAPFLAGTVVGMAPWMVFYATIGSTGRAVLQSGGDLTSVLAGKPAQTAFNSIWFKSITPVVP
eukprot:1188657-Prorocentrum_minimum.AAC.2